MWVSVKSISAYELTFPRNKQSDQKQYSKSAESDERSLLRRSLIVEQWIFLQQIRQDKNNVEFLTGFPSKHSEITDIFISLTLV